MTWSQLGVSVERYIYIIYALRYEYIVKLRRIIVFAVLLLSGIIPTLSLSSVGGLSFTSRIFNTTVICVMDTSTQLAKVSYPCQANALTVPPGIVGFARGGGNTVRICSLVLSINKKVRFLGRINELINNSSSASSSELILCGNCNLPCSHYPRTNSLDANSHSTKFDHLQNSRF